MARKSKARADSRVTLHLHIPAQLAKRRAALPAARPLALLVPGKSEIKCLGATTFPRHPRYLQSITTTSTAELTTETGSRRLWSVTLFEFEIFLRGKSAYFPGTPLH